jgi:hypothetical protein
MLAPLLLTVLLVVPSQGDVLSRARLAYNTQRFDEAITLAAEARGIERLTHSASLVFARASLERFRVGNDVADVATARQALLSIDPARLSATETAELRLGTAELLFVDDQFGAAAEIFEAALGTVDPLHRDRVLDWWASSLDRHAQLAPEGERQRRYSRLLAGAERELSRAPSSAVAVYWLAAASRGVDDLDRAWSVAVAGWIQAPAMMPGVRGTTLQHDLDRLMREAIIPERARRAAPPADPEALKVALAAEWASIKQRWAR